VQATVLYGERDIRFEDRPEPIIVEATDAILRLPFTCICGSDLWPYRGIQAVLARPDGP
jgi:threonine dehydrogenase-like Zn-dependent dehydrogenase